MLEQTLAIIRNTFFESIRQPIVLVVLMIASLLLILSNPLSAFTMEDDQRMMIDLGMATIFVGGAILAAFVATGVLTREIENKTALTVISKPVSRPLFVIGKFLGVGGALILCTALLSFVFLLAEEHSVLQTVRDPYHLPVLTFGTIAGVLGIGAAILANYFFDKVFASTAIVFLTPLTGLAYLFSLMFGPDFSPQPIGINAKPDLWLGLICVGMAILVLTAIAIALSARLGQVMTLCLTLGIFLLGLLSDTLIGRRINNLEEIWLSRAQAAGLTTTETFTRQIELASGQIQSPFDPETRIIATVPLTDMAEGSERLLHGFYWVIYSILPNFQLLWPVDALTQGFKLPGEYVGMALGYGVLYIGVALSLAIILFQRREVG